MNENLFDVSRLNEWQRDCYFRHRRFALYHAARDYEARYVTLALDGSIGEVGKAGILEGDIILVSVTPEFARDNQGRLKSP